LHSLGFVHGDLKPQNILLSKDLGNDQNIYLIDFGISQSYLNDDGSHIDLDQNSGFKGTIAFSALKENVMSSKSI
jgi:serine/threonine protein kinase